MQLICADIVKIPSLQGPPMGLPRVEYITDEYLECLADSIGVKVMLLTFMDS